MSLIQTHAPKSDESGMGYYRRLASDNVLNWRDLATTAGVDRTRSALLTHPVEVARNLGLEPTWTAFVAEHEAISKNWKRLRRTQSEAVCPGCLGDSAYLRHAWEHTYVTACPQHRCVLVDHCDACEMPLSAERLYIGLCGCGHELAQLPRSAATKSQLWLSTLICSDGQTSAGSKPVVQGISVEILTNVVRTLCRYSSAGGQALPKSAAHPQTVAEAVEFLAPLEDLLLDWPTNFQAHVEKRIAVGRKEARTLNTRLGEWYISLRKLCQDTALEPLVEVVINVAARKSDCVLGLDSASKLAIDATGYTKAPDAAKAIGVSVSRLHASLSTGECGHRARRTGTRGQLFEIPCDEVARIQMRRAAWTSDDDASEVAGVSKAVLDLMKSAHVIQSDVRWKEDLFKGGPVERQSILNLYEFVLGRIQKDVIQSEPIITWAEFTSRRMGDRKAIEELMQAIANGKVQGVVRGRTLGETSFLKADVSQYFGTPLLEAGMSIQRLSQLTGWKWESISHWIDAGLLDSDSITLRGQPCRIVSPQQLAKFQQTYIPLADLAHCRGTKSSALLRLLQGVELVGAKELPDGAKRGGLIRISDLCGLAIIGARAGQDLFVHA